MCAIEVKKFNHNNQELAIRFGLGAVKAVGLKMLDGVCQERDRDGKFSDIYDFTSRAGSRFVNKKSIEALAKSGAFDNIHKNRHQILESQEILSRFSSQQEKERSNPQMSLFSNEVGLKDKIPDLINCKNWEKKERLEREFEAFGFFPNEHPTEDYIEDLQKRGILTSEFLELEVKNNQTPMDQEKMIKKNIKSPKKINANKNDHSVTIKCCWAINSSEPGEPEHNKEVPGSLTSTNGESLPQLNFVIDCKLNHDDSSVLHICLSNIQSFLHTPLGPIFSISSLSLQIGKTLLQAPIATALWQALEESKDTPVSKVSSTQALAWLSKAVT